MRTPGKKMPNGYYVHKSCKAIMEDLFDINVEYFEGKLPQDFRYDIIKYNPKENQVTFTYSPDWDTPAHESIVGDAILVRSDGSIRLLKQHKDPWIYHHKWMFVADDYTGFDVERSKRRSKQWTSVPGINKSRIGKKSYWEKEVLPMLQ